MSRPPAPGATPSGSLGLADEPGPDDQIQFIACHRPGLPDGDYTLEVGQELTIAQAATNAKPVTTTRWFPAAVQNFTVSGERFSLPPTQLCAVFPPPGGRGSFWRDLPHVVLERSTLPWERTALRDPPNDAAPPWLALIVFHDAEVPREAPATAGQTAQRSTVALGSLKPCVTGAYRWPGIGVGVHADPALPSPIGTMESGQRDDDLVTVIDIPRNLLEAQLPAFDHQTHCRGRLAHLQTEAALPPTPTEEQVLDRLRQVLGAQQPAVALSPGATAKAAQQRWRVRDHAFHAAYEVWVSRDGHWDYYRVARENAIVLGRRLPMPGERNAVHLVSLEGRYTSQSGAEVFDFQGAGDDKLIRLVSLHNWEFFCVDPARDFAGLLENLNIAPDPGSSSLRDTAPSFGLPIPADARGRDAEKFLRAGFVPLTHRFRQGGRSVSWYHGPLVPGEIDMGGMTPLACAADELLIFDRSTGLFDASYAAAWELGRMLTLRNLRVATSLYHWKREHAHSMHSARYLAEYGFELPIDTAGHAPAGSLPADVDRWLNELTLLRHVPFSYLVPDERLLPMESLRFFTLDRFWLECLRDGAFSIDRVSAADHERDVHSRPLAMHETLPTISGYLLRSEVVSGFWPSLRVKAYSEAVPLCNLARFDDREISNLGAAGQAELSHSYPVLPLLRKDRLAKNVMICLHMDRSSDGDGNGIVRMVDVHLKPEMLHFGFEEREAGKPFDPADLAQAAAHLVKKRRDPTGNLIEPDPADPATAQLDGLLPAQSRVVDLAGLASRMGVTDPSRFALDMIAGTDLVRLCRR